ncbi:MAG: hypothetical protein ACE5FT_04425 [Candidatus Nanoarchaeia archaeon]
MEFWNILAALLGVVLAIVSLVGPELRIITFIGGGLFIMGTFIYNNYHSIIDSQNQLQEVKQLYDTQKQLSDIKAKVVVLEK